MNNGAFGENFPYSNFHDLNMDWIIKIAKDFLDQYTHIQEIIEQGKTDIQNLTEQGIESISELTTDSINQLNSLHDEIENALNEWYNTHSADIANQLATALASLNAWYNTHIVSINTALETALSEFATRAEVVARETIETIPADYTALSNKVLMLENYTGEKAGEIYLMVDNSLSDWEQGGLTSDGQPQPDATNIRTVDYINVVNATKLIINSTFNYWVFWYDYQGRFLVRETGWQTGYNVYDTKATNKNYAKILLHTSDVADFTEITVVKLDHLIATLEELDELGIDGRINTYFLNSTDYWHNGGINSSGDDNNNDAIHFRSDFCYVKNCNTVTIKNTQFQYWVFWYDEKKAYLGRESDWQSGTNTYQINGQKAYIRILANLNTKIYWPSFRVFGDNKSVILEADMPELLSEIEPNYNYAMKHHSLDSSKLFNGGLNSDGAFNENGIYVVTDYYPIHGAKNIYVNMMGYRYWIFWYDSGKNFIKREDNWTSDKLTDVPKIASYARILIECRKGKDRIVYLKGADIHTNFIKYCHTKRMLYDTDLDLDVDDAVALRCLVWANRNHSIDVVGICTSIDGSVEIDGTTYYSASFINTMLNYDGTPDIPIAINHNRVGHNCWFIKDIISNFYHTINDNNLPNAVDLYRVALGSLPDGEKLDICNVGYNLNLSALINSSADNYVPKTGLELIKEHVNNIYIMGGDYPASTDTAEGNFSNGAGAIQATNTLLTTDFNNKIIFLGRESGWPVQSGGSLANMTNDPLYMALKAYNHGTFSPRSSYDPLTILIASLGWNEMGFETIRGTNTINTSTGKNTFTENNTGHHYYVKYKYTDMNYYVNIINTILVRNAWQ